MEMEGAKYIRSSALRLLSQLQAFDSLQSDAVHTCKLTRHIDTGLAIRVARGYNNHMKYNIYIYNILHRGDDLNDVERFGDFLPFSFGLL